MAASYEDWLKTRPKVVQDLAAEFPRGSTFFLPDGKIVYLLGYTEEDSLICSLTDPFKDYDKARAEVLYLCASHYRKKNGRD